MQPCLASLWNSQHMNFTHDLEAQDDDWTDGLACKAVKQLQEKFRPVDTISLVDEKLN